MKQTYEMPCAEVIDLTAMESIALLEGHPDEQANTNDGGDQGVFSVIQGVGDGHF